jgi:hypothetical protein
MLVIERPLVGQTETPRATISQPHAQARFQRLDTAADSGRRGPQRLCAGGDAARLRDSAKKLDVAKAVRQHDLPCFRWKET